MNFNYKMACTILLCATQSVWADALSGVYVGLAGTYSTFSAKLDATLDLMPGGTFFGEVHPINRLADTGWGGVASLGYEFIQVRPFYMAFEFQAPFSGIELEEKDADGAVTTLTMSQTYLLQARPGYQFVPNVPAYLYAIAGVAYSKFELDTGDLGLLAFTDHSWGFQGGIGVAYALKEHLRMRMEYTYTGYLSIDNEDTGFVDTGSGTLIDASGSAKISPSLGQLLVGFTYVW